tara:strand:- start:2146 stop:2370 length:225 start_codon:yes stop_codon:yes gene_type:complete
MSGTMESVTTFSELKESLQKSLKDFDMKELSDMNDDLVVLIDSLIQRQIALQEVILDRLDNAYYSTKNPSQKNS